MNDRKLLTSLAILALLGAACGSATAGGAGRSQAPAGFWDYWGDGYAELAGYSLQQPRYGELRTGEAVLITVTETFTTAQRVKSDGGHPDEVPVIKLNEVRDFQTGIYDYNAMSSAFVPLDGSTARGVPTKVSMSLQEWCGHAFEQLVVDPGSIGRTFHSYFDGEGDQANSLELPSGGVFADAMPLLVRGVAGDLLKPGESREVPWLPTLLDGRLTHAPTAWSVATISRGDRAAELSVPAGVFNVLQWEARPVDGPAVRWFVQIETPQLLVAWERDGGERAELLGVQRRKYWEEQGEGDERLLEGLGLRSRTWPGSESR